MIKDALKASHVGKAYGGTPVVQDASLTLAPGTLTAILGPSGAGKSTFLRLIAGLEPVDRGEICLGERVLSAPTLTIPAEQRRIGMIFQDYALFPHMTALENVCFGLTHLDKAAARARASDWLARLSMEARQTAYPHQLSGGEQQRVAIARALAPDPGAILMDEPFSGLDPALEAGVREAALHALSNAGKPALIVTHDPIAAMAMADQLAIMLNGTVIQSGAPQDIYRDPANLEVARALGPMQAIDPDRLPPSLLAGLVPQPQNGHSLGLRDDWIILDPTADTEAKVTSRAFQGATWRVTLALGPETLTARVPAAGAIPNPGEIVQVRLVPQGRFIFEGP